MLRWWLEVMRLRSLHLLKLLRVMPLCLELDMLMLIGLFVLSTTPLICLLLHSTTYHLKIIIILMDKILENTLAVQSFIINSIQSKLSVKFAFISSNFFLLRNPTSKKNTSIFQSFFSNSKLSI